MGNFVTRFTLRRKKSSIEYLASSICFMAQKAKEESSYLNLRIIRSHLPVPPTSS